MFCDWLGNDIDNGDCQSFWRNVKFELRPCNLPPTMRVGEETSEDTIINMWKQHFGDIINSEPMYKIDEERREFEKQCSFVLKESVQYYLEKGNLEMFGCALDLSKAYDRVSQYKLLSKLLDAGCPAHMVKFLQVWYDGAEHADQME